MPLVIASLSIMRDLRGFLNLSAGLELALSVEIELVGFLAVLTPSAFCSDL